MKNQNVQQAEFVQLVYHYSERKDIVIVTKKENYSQIVDFHWITLLK